MNSIILDKGRFEGWVLVVILNYCLLGLGKLALQFEESRVVGSSSRFNVNESGGFEGLKLDRRGIVNLRAAIDLVINNNSCFLGDGSRCFLADLSDAGGLAKVWLFNGFFEVAFTFLLLLLELCGFLHILVDFMKLSSQFDFLEIDIQFVVVHKV